MSKVVFDPDEPVLAELSPTRRSVIFPVLELLLITGLIWLGIGGIDRYFASVAMTNVGYEFTPLSDVRFYVNDPLLTPMLWLRRGLVVLWLWLAWRRCIRHLIYRARSRMVLTDRRLITASGHVRSRIAEIPMYAIMDARSTGSTVSIFVVGQRMPVVLQSVPQAKKFARLVRTIVKDRDDSFR